MEYNSLGQSGESVEIPVIHHFSCPCPLNVKKVVKCEGSYNIAIKSKSECQIFEFLYFMISCNRRRFCTNNEKPAIANLV